MSSSVADASSNALPHSSPLTASTATARRNGFIGAFLGWVFDGYETYATVLVAAAVVNDLVGPGTARTQPIFIGGILAATLVAWAVGGVFSGILADYFGRRRVLLYSILWYAIFAGLTALAPSYLALLALRFLTGIGMGAEWGALNYGTASIEAVVSPICKVPSVSASSSPPQFGTSSTTEILELGVGCM
jgi:MFS family permease